MNVSLLGSGWTTPLGRDVGAVTRRVRNSEIPNSCPLETRDGTLEALRIPPDDVAAAAALPRLRRSGVISHFAVTAALDAVASAGLTGADVRNCALIFVSTDGGVGHTCRFFSGVVESGLGSPLLFPETVYNAPASHIAAALNLDGEALTLVGDSATTIHAIETACLLLSSPGRDCCLVVAAQEIDPVNAVAYARAGAVRGPSNPRSAVIAEGAAAVVLGKSGAGPRLHIDSPGFTWRTRRDAMPRLEASLRSADDPVVVLPGASASPSGACEAEACHSVFPTSRQIETSASLGESFTCSVLQRIVLAGAMNDIQSLIPAIGCNGQAGVVRVTKD